MSSDESISDDLYDALVRVTGVLNSQQAKYALIGGLGASVRGSLRATRDVDLLLSLPPLKLASVLDELSGSGFDLDAKKCIRDWSSDSLTEFQFGRVRIDWLKATLPVFETVLARANWEEVGGEKVHVADPEGLILMKLISFRPVDQQDIAAMLATNVGQLEIAWIRSEWAKLKSLAPDRGRDFEQMVVDYYH